MPILRSKSAVKKRKSELVIDVDASEEVCLGDIIEKMQVWCNSASKKLSILKEDHAAEVERLQDLQKTTLARVEHYEFKSGTLEKKLLQLEVSSSMKMQEVVDGTKLSATRAVLQSRIRMAKEAKAEGVELWATDVEKWKAKLEELSGGKAAKSEGEPSKKNEPTKELKDAKVKDAEVVNQAESSKAVVKDKEVLAGDEGKGAKA